MPVIITSRSATGHILASPNRKQGIQHIVSITDPADKAPFGFWQSTIHKKNWVFEDVQDPKATFAPSVEIISQMISFFERWPAEELGLIHCFAGQSRSTAAAAILFMIQYGDPVVANEKLRESVLFSLQNKYRSGGSYFPNPLMLRVADDILGMNGVFASSITGGIVGG